MPYLGGGRMGHRQLLKKAKVKAKAGRGRGGLEGATVMMTGDDEDEEDEHGEGWRKV